MNKILFCIASVFLVFAGCMNMEPSASGSADEVLSAIIEQEDATKTVLGMNNNIFWSENDQIIAFMKTSYGHRYQILPSFVGKTYADFARMTTPDGDNLSAGMRWDHNVAYYPYAEGVECVKADDGYVVDVVLPDKQEYVAGSFGQDAWPMVAVSEYNDIAFKNVCGGMKLQIKGVQKIISITLRGNNKEKLSGPAVVTAHADESMPSIRMTDAASEIVCLDCGEGVQLRNDKPAEFIIALPPVEFSKGFILTLTDDGNQTHIIETDKTNTVLRSTLLVMPVCELGTQQEENIEYTLSQGYASEGTLNNNAAHRVKTNMIYGSFSVKVNEGYVIRAVYTYPTAAVTSDYTCILANCTDRTGIDVLNEGRYAVITFADAYDPKAAISPSEDIIKSLTRYGIGLPGYSGTANINKAVFFGDSIMHGVYSYFADGTDGRVLRMNGFNSNLSSYPRIPDYFAMLSGASVTNNAKRGSGWITDTRGWGNAYEMAGKTDFSQYDFAAFCLGINDWIQGARIGSLDDPGKTGGSISEGTVVANMIACIEKVKKENPDCRVVVYSPYISWGQYSDGGDYTSDTLYGDMTTGYALGAANKAGYTLQDLIDVIDQVCSHYGIRHVPLSKSEVCTLETVKDIMIDGLHPSREAMPLLALEILEQCGE